MRTQLSAGPISVARGIDIDAISHSGAHDAAVFSHGAAIRAWLSRWDLTEWQGRPLPNSRHRQCAREIRVLPHLWDSNLSLELAKQRTMSKATRFSFDGGAATYCGTAILGVLITTFTLGICYPFAVVLTERWRCKHTYIDGQQLVFVGTATGLFGRWILWLFLSIITFGIFLFWAIPKIQYWKTVNTEFAAPSTPITAWAPNVLQTS